MNKVEIVKVFFLGDRYVGKTSLRRRLVYNHFDPEDNFLFMGAQYETKTVEFNEFHIEIKFELWDIYRREKYIPKIYLRDTKVAILVYDITNKKSFEEIKSYYYDIAKLNCNSDAIFVVLGNKCDRYNESQVSEEEGKEFARSINAIFQLTSCKNDTDFNNLFDIIGRKYLYPIYDFQKKEKFKKVEENKELKEKKKKITLKDFKVLLENKKNKLFSFFKKDNKNNKNLINNEDNEEKDYKILNEKYVKTIEELEKK